MFTYAPQPPPPRGPHGGGGKVGLNRAIRAERLSELDQCAVY